MIEHRYTDRSVVDDGYIANAAEFLDAVAEDADAARDVVAVDGDVFDERPLGLSGIAEGDYGGISGKGPSIGDEGRPSASAGGRASTSDDGAEWHDPWRRCRIDGTCRQVEVDRFAGMHQDFAEGISRTVEKTKKSSCIDFSAVDWKRRDSILDLNAGVGAGKLVGEFNFIGGFDVRLTLGRRAQREEQQEC